MKSGKATAVIVVAILLAVIVLAGIKFLGPNASITGAASAGSCSGNPSACSTYDNSDACKAVGCTWYSFFCWGNPSACNTYTDQDSCTGVGCTWKAAAAETNCSNGIDDDSDYATDCADSDCLNKACGGTTSCPSGSSGSACDNVCNAAGSCTCTPTCAETNCTDGKDNDGDGYIDCLDPDCYANDPACAGGIDCSKLPQGECSGYCTPASSCVANTNYTCAFTLKQGFCSNSYDSNENYICACFSEINCQNTCIKGSCGASCGNDSDCQASGGGLSCQGQNIVQISGSCNTTTCSCGGLKNETTKTCSNTGENDTCASPLGLKDCNACDVQGDQSGNQGGWADANADKCDPACNSYFDSLNQAHITASSPAVNASTFQLKPEVACDGIDNDCNGIID